MNKLWYKNPAKDWNEALPLGNGRLGAMVFGELGHEIIQLNEESVWSGTYRDRNNYSCLENLPTIQALLKDGRLQEAQELAYESMTGCPSQQTVYQTVGDLHIDFYTEETRGLLGPLPNRKDVFKGYTEYKRELDLETAVCTTAFSVESPLSSTAIFSRNTHGSSITYTREIFISAVTDVIVIHISASTPKSIFLRAHFDRGDISGMAFTLEDCIALSDSHGIPYCALATAVSSGGTVQTRGSFLVVEGADEVTLYVDVETAFRNRHYAKRGGTVAKSAKSLISWCTNEALKKICFAISETYQEALAAHIAEYEQWYKRIQLNLTTFKESAQQEEKLPTDELLLEHAESPALAELYWNFGRYLLISSSRRPGTLPATLQGLWNKDLTPPWGSKYTININTEMNYWPAAMCALAETEEPLFALLKRAYKHGKKTAEGMYGCDGYVAHHNLDIWADTAPQDQWIPGTYWVLGAAWLATHIFEHYEYTQDKKFLKKHFYLLSAACDFFCQYLQPSLSGDFLVICPSVSPENTYKLPNGEVGSFSFGTDMDNRILEHLFHATLSAARILGVPDTNADVVRYKAVLSKIEPPVITSQKTIREWPVECEEIEPGHRHISQLYGLFPGHSIHYNRTPDLAQAAHNTIEKRLLNGGGHTGWSQAWIMNFRASLHEAQEAQDSLFALFKKSTLPNLFDNHPPFQIDGNFGALTAMTRMIVQSEIANNKVEIDILPALPPAWHSGSLTGVALKGNLRIDISWKNNALAAAQVYALPGTRFIKDTVICFCQKRYKASLADDGTLDVLNVLPSTIAT